MKKIILLAACLFTITATTKAQEVVQPKKELHHKGEHQVEGETKDKAPVKDEHNGHEHGKGDHAMKTPAERAQQSVDGLNKRVALTEDQKPKIYSLAMDRVTKADAIRDKYKGPENKATAKAELETIRKEYRQQVKSLLTPEQIASLKEKAKTHKGEGMGKGKGQQHGKGKGLDKPKGKPENDKSENENSEDELID